MCGTSTALGLPVVPDVTIVYAMSCEERETTVSLFGADSDKISLSMTCTTTVDSSSRVATMASHFLLQRICLILHSEIHSLIRCDVDCVSIGT